MEMDEFEELELGIKGIESEEEEERLAGILRGLRGVRSVRLVLGGAHITYNSLAILAEEIITTVRQAGYELVTHQKTGEL